MKTQFHRENAPASRDLREEIAAGLRWLWSKPLIRFMAFLTGGINLVNAAMPLLIIVLAKELGAGDAQIGIIFSIGGAGAILGSLVGGRIQRRFTFGQVIVAAMWIEACAFLLFVAMPSYIWLGVLAALLSFIGPVYNVVQFSYRVALIPDELQGRVNSTFRLLAFGFMPLGAALSGFVIERYGVTAAVLIFAACLFVLAILTSLNRHVRDAPAIEVASA